VSGFVPISRSPWRFAPVLRRCDPSNVSPIV